MKYTVRSKPNDAPYRKWNTLVVPGEQVNLSAGVRNGTLSPRPHGCFPTSEARLNWILEVLNTDHDGVLFDCCVGQKILFGPKERDTFWYETRDRAGGPVKIPTVVSCAIITGSMRFTKVDWTARDYKIYRISRHDPFLKHYLGPATALRDLPRPPVERLEI